MKDMVSICDKRGTLIFIDPRHVEGVVGHGFRTRIFMGSGKHLDVNVEIKKVLDLLGVVSA